MDDCKSNVQFRRFGMCSRDAKPAKRAEDGHSRREPWVCRLRCGLCRRYAEIAVNQAYVDRNLITAPAWPARPAWLEDILKLLGTKVTL